MFQPDDKRLNKEKGTEGGAPKLLGIIARGYAKSKQNFTLVPRCPSSEFT